MVDQTDRRGVHNWLAQRVTAVFIAIYTIFLVIYLISHSAVDYPSWQALFQPLWMKIATVLAFLSIMIHAWLGVWTVLTDYVKPKALRFVLELLVIVALLASLIWLFDILW